MIQTMATRVLLEVSFILYVLRTNYYGTNHHNFIISSDQTMILHVFFRQHVLDVLSAACSLQSLVAASPAKSELVEIVPVVRSPKGIVFVLQSYCHKL
jgi:hypothetical protein